MSATSTSSRCASSPGSWRLLILLGALRACRSRSRRPPAPRRPADARPHLDDVLLNGLLASAVLPLVALAVATAAFGNELSRPDARAT